MSEVHVDKERAFAALDTSVARYAAALRAVKDPKASAIGHWNVADLATHTAQLFEIYARIPSEGPPDTVQVRGIAQTWDEMVRAETGVTVHDAAARIEHAAKIFSDAVADLDGSEKLPWYSGTRVSVSGLASILVQESEVHGFDVTRSQGRAWDIPREAAIVSVAGLQEVIPYFVDEDAAANVHACVDLRVRDGERYFWVFDGPHLSVEPPSERRVDVHLSVDPVAYLLVGYNRISQWREMAKGKLFAWGRNPLLALRLSSLLRVP